jgi:hypothetical protein
LSTYYVGAYTGIEVYYNDGYLYLRSSYQGEGGREINEQAVNNEIKRFIGWNKSIRIRNIYYF